MSSNQQKQTPSLSLVKESRPLPEGHDVAHGPDRTLDWSICMARAQAGDREAYRRVLEEIAPYIRSIAVRYVRDRGHVEDAVQDVLLTVHAIRHTYDPMRPFGPWLVAIAKRRVVDGLRRRGRAAAHETVLDAAHETFAAPESNYHEMTSEGRALRDALEQLPAGQREAIRMVKLQEMSLKDAAAASGMSVAALKVATHRGIKRLRKIFGTKDPAT